MKRSLLFISTCLLLVVSSGVGTAQVTQYYEDFTTTTYRDAGNTTAWWDVAMGQLKLYPFVPTQVGACGLTGFTYDVALAGDLAYVAAYTSGLHVVDITNTASPTVIGSYNTSGETYGVCFSGNFAFLADGGIGLVIVDISDPTTPTQVGFYDTPGFPFGLCVDGDYAYVGDGDAGLQVIDITDPTAPVVVGTYGTTGQYNGVFISGDHAYVPDAGLGLQVVDISDPTTPALVGSYDTPGIPIALYVDGNYVFVADYTAGLQVIDISDPTAPALAGSYDALSYAYKVVVSGDRAYVTDLVSGLHVIDISDPATPTLVVSYDTYSTPYSVDVAGEHAFVGYGGGLEVVKIKDTVTPEYAGAVGTTTRAKRLHISGNHAYMAIEHDGIAVVDITDPSAPVLVGSYDTGIAERVYVSGDYAFVADYLYGLFVLDITDPSSPGLVGTVDPGDIAYDVVVAGDHAYTASNTYGLFVIDISDPTTPTIVGNYNTTGQAKRVVVDGNHAFVADDFSGIKVIDISDPTTPTLVGSVTGGGQPRGMCIRGDHAFIAWGGGGLQVIDISDPTSPAQVGSYAMNAALGVDIDGDLAYVANGVYGLYVIDISDPTSPDSLEVFDTAGNAWDVRVAGNIAFVADANDGLLALQVYQDNTETLAESGRSLELDTADDTVLRAWLTAAQTDSVAWELSADGGTNWQLVQADAGWNRFTFPGDVLLWRSTPTWTANGEDPVVSDLTIQWIYEHASVNAVADVPDDQGGWVRVHFTRSGLDFADEVSLPIDEYGIWQRVDNPSLVAAINAAPSPATDISFAGDKPLITYGGGTYLQSGPGLATASFPAGTWELVLSVPAVQRDDIFARVSTTADSSASGPNYSVYVITAHTTTPSIWYTSPPDSGYSVDNIAPIVPASFVVSYNTGAGNHLTWDVCPDDDFQYHNVYRSADPDFDPSPATLVHSTIDTEWNDPEFDGWAVYYKVTAFDYAGNESPPASAGTATGITERVMPKHVSLGQNVPNPFNPSTTISIGLPVASDVILSVFDVGGHRVATIFDGTVPAGYRSFTWHGLDNNGRRVGSGVYFCRLEAGGEVFTRKMLLLK